LPTGARGFARVASLEWLWFIGRARSENRRRSCRTKVANKKTTPPVLIQFGLKDMDVAPSGTEKKKPAITI